MSRNHAVVQFAIWRDPEFRTLTADAQWAYLMLLSQPHVSQAGTLPLMPGKWAKGCGEMTAGRLRGALEALEAARFVFIDEDTEEALIRSFIRNDGVLRQPNVLKSALKSAALLESDKLREVMRFELQRIAGEVTREDVAALMASTIDELAPLNPPATLREPSPNPSGTLPAPEPFANPSRTPREPHGEGEGEGEVDNLDISSGSPLVGAASDADSSEEVEAALEIVEEAPAPKATKAKRGTRIPEDFMPSPETVARIRSQFPAVTSEDLQLKHDSFVDYWIAATGRNAVKLEWDRAWSGWMRREFDHPRYRATAAAGPTARDRKRARAEALKHNPDPAILARGGIAAGATVAPSVAVGGRTAPALLPALEA